MEGSSYLNVSSNHTEKKSIKAIAKQIISWLCIAIVGWGFCPYQ